MSFLNTTEISVLWNRKRLEPFRPKRGLKQGDPLSAYLFVLCMETLGQKIRAAVSKKEWQVYQVRKDKTEVSHLFFADDLLLFGAATTKQAKIMFDVLQTFYDESRQRVNGAKSKI